MKKIIFTLGLIILFSAKISAQKIDEVGNMSQEQFEKKWTKAVQYGVANTKWIKPMEDGSGTIPFLSKLGGVPKKIALVNFYIYDPGSKQQSMTHIFTTSISEKGGNMFANNFLADGLEGMKAAFAARGMEILLPEQYLDTEEKKKNYYEFNPEVSGFTKVMQSATNTNKGSATDADNFHYMYISDGRDFKLSNSMGDALCKILGVDAVLSVVTNCTTDGQYFGLNAVRMCLHGPNPMKPVEGAKYGGVMGKGYNAGQCYQCTNVDIVPGYLFLQKHPKKGILYESYKGYGRYLTLLSKILANSVADRVEGKPGNGEN